MNIEKIKWAKRFDFFMLAAWLVMGLALAIVALVRFGNDFRGYYAAARVLLSGGNPYDYEAVAQILLEVTGRMGNNPYYYPPWFAWFFTPIVSLPYQIARVIWMAINFTIWNVGLWQLAELVGWPKRGWHLYSLFTLVTCTFAWITWKYEQAGFLIFFMLILLIASIQAQRWIMSGIWMALLLIKPNITLIVVAGISLWLLRKGQWRTILVMLFMLGVLLSLSTWITPDWFHPILEDGFGRGLTMTLDGPDKITALRLNTTLLDWLTTFGIERQFHLPLYGACLIVGLLAFFATVNRSQSFLELVSVLLLISTALTPYALQYDYPPLAIALFWAMSLCAPSPKSLSVAVLLAGFIFSVIFWQKNIAWGFWMVIGLIAMAILALYQRPVQKSVRKKIQSNGANE